MNIKMTTNSQPSAIESKKQKKKKLSKQPEQEQNHRYGDHLGVGRGRMGQNVHELRSIIGRYKIDRGRLRTVQEMEKPKNLHAQPMDMN